jgi:signal transduction histidine kinase
VKRFRPSIRLLLTLIYVALFGVSGALLLGLDVGLLVGNQVPVISGIVGPRPPSIVPPPGVPGLEVAPPVPPPRADMAPPLDPWLIREKALALVTLTALEAGLCWVLAGRILRPLQDITRTARRASLENLHERIGLEGPDDELMELAATFDAMLARLETAAEAQRQFAANASHELRTPLAIMRTVVDVTLGSPTRTVEQLERMAIEIRHAVERAERLVESLLTLGWSERGTRETRPVNLATATDEVLRRIRPQADLLGLRMDQMLEDAEVSGDPHLLELMVGNLVENAVRHNVPAGWVVVATGCVGGERFVRVRNSGRAVRADQVQSLLEPFKRLGPARTDSPRGAGLGLSIVRSVTSSHRGRLTVEALAEGGLDVRVELPGCQPVAD